jgi:predicted Zn-dependent protease
LRGRSVIVGMVASLCEMHLDYIYHLTREAHLRKTPKNGKRRAKALSLAQTWPESPLALNNSSWSIAREAGHSEKARAQALRRAEAAVNAVPRNPAFLTTLGAALYRSRRFDEAIHRVEEGIKLSSESSAAADWAFLAMAHHRLGHRDEALRWLARFQNGAPNSDSFWDAEDRLLRAEAEAVILYDPIFPADPFAH